MKRIISLVIASAAVAMALVSCTKENISNKEVEKGINADGTRTLTVSFAPNPTKTTLSTDGVTPVWAEGDKISLNGIEYSVPSDAIGKKEFTLKTTETGAITAVYPADAYQSTEPYFKVSDEQDGSFGCANICVAQAAAGENTLTFENKTAVFAVAVPEGTTKLTVTSLGKIDATGQRGKTAADTVAINTTKTGSTANVIIVEKEDKSAFEDTVYVAVAVDTETGVLLADLNFDTGKAQGGVSPKYIKSKGKEPLEYKAVAGTIYTPVLHEYVVVNGKKWATMNIGATASKGKGVPQCWGYYLAWGAVIPIYKSFSTNGQQIQFYFAPNNPDAVRYTGTWPPESVFAACNAPYYNSSESKYTKYTGTDNKLTLDLVDDAAYYCWGGSWRMPTKEEFDGLIGLIKSYDQTDNGCYIGDDSPDSEKFFLTGDAGMCTGATLMRGVAGNYWTSSLNPDNSNRALTFDIAKGNKGFDDTMSDDYRERSYGRTVRAFSE